MNTIHEPVQYDPSETPEQNVQRCMETPVQRFTIEIVKTPANMSRRAGWEAELKEAVEGALNAHENRYRGLEGIYLNGEYTIVVWRTAT